MALITLRQLLDHAAEHGYGVPAFNINNMEQGLAIVKAAAEVDAPVILQASRGARSYAGDIMLRRAAIRLRRLLRDDDALGRLVAVTQPAPNEAEVLRSFDLRGRLAQARVTHRRPSTADHPVPTEHITFLTYAYDEADNLLGVVSSNADGVALEYTYDPLNRLASVLDHGAQVPPLAHTYTYNEVGSLTSLITAHGIRPHLHLQRPQPPHRPCRCRSPLQPQLRLQPQRPRPPHGNHRKRRPLPPVHVRSAESTDA